jgi:Trypsin
MRSFSIVVLCALGGIATAQASHDEPARSNLRGGGTEQESVDRDLAFSNSTSGSGSGTPHQNIVGGVVATARPWFVEAYGCGGTLIWKDFVLTAAHCWAATAADSAWPVNYPVWIGNTRTQTVVQGVSETRVIKKVFRHPSYNGNTNQNDFMLVQLKTVVSTNRVLAKYNGDSAKPVAGQSLTTIVRSSRVKSIPDLSTSIAFIRPIRR